MSHQRLSVDRPMRTSFLWHMGALIAKGIGAVMAEVWRCLCR